jgi:putative ABC transport system permease protein
VRILSRIGAIFVVALKRLFAERRLALLTIAGLTVAVAITLSVPLYADAVYGRTLGGILLEKSPAEEARPPFAFMFRHLASGSGPARWDNIQAADAYLSEQAPTQLGLPLKQNTRYLATGYLGLFPSETTSAYFTIRNQLALISLGTAGGFEDRVTLTEGRFPSAADRPDGNPIGVLVHSDQATKLGLQVGETYLLFDNDMGLGGTPVQIPVRVAGVWKPTDPQDEYWFYRPWALTDVFFVPETSFTGQIIPQMRNPTSIALWYWVLDGSSIRPGDTPAFLERTASVSQQAAALLPGLKAPVSPVEALEKYRQAATLLTILLYAFSIPILALILAFISLVANLTVGQQRNQIAVLRSRGGTTLQVIGIAALEGLVLTAVALALAWPLSLAFAGVIGRSRSFLNFSHTTEIQPQMSPAVLRFGLVMAAVALLTLMIPTLGAARHTIITYKQERARAERAPWWQRAWIDVLLLICTGYGVYLLRKQGAIALLPAITDTASGDPFQNPLLFLIPALGVFSLTLVMLRALPLVMRAIAWLFARTRSVGLLLAARHLARHPGSYAAPLLLLVLTLSLSAFTASLAQTLNSQLYDQSYYRAGADLRVHEAGADAELADEAAYAANNTAALRGAVEDEGPRWLFLPVMEHLKVPGVQRAARVGRYPATALLSSRTVLGSFLGVDRADFPQVAFWRRDFAPRPLGALMNALALAPDGLLTSHDFMEQYALKIGDTLRLNTGSYGPAVNVDFTIVGEFDLFPTWYPADGPLFVGNLDYYFDQIGGQVPHSVWLKTGPDQEFERIIKDVKGLGLTVVEWDAPLRDIAEEQRRPERQGLFGLLSVGFMAAALLTVIGFLLYALFSFRRRTIELGILRAIGLSAGQMAAFLTWELLFLIATGLVVGTGLGAWISRIFIPYLQVGAGPDARVPPFLVEIAWPAILRIYALFGLLFLIALVLLVWLLRRTKIFQAIKLGETV